MGRPGRRSTAISRRSGSRRPRFPPVPLSASTCAPGEIASIVWATGYRPDLSWLHVPVLDRKGRVVHDGGVTAAPGLYLIGMPFLRRRKSSLIDGAAADAAELTAHLAPTSTLAAGCRDRPRRRTVVDRGRAEGTIMQHRRVPPRSPPRSPAATAGGWPPR